MGTGLMSLVIKWEFLEIFSLELLCLLMNVESFSLLCTCLALLVIFILLQSLRVSTRDHIHVCTFYIAFFDFLYSATLVVIMSNFKDSPFSKMTNSVNINNGHPFTTNLDEAFLNLSVSQVTTI